MAIKAILVINKSGGLVYHRNFSNEESLSSNDYLIIASTLHGAFAIASQLTPRAVQLGEASNAVDYTIPYIPYVGFPRSNANQNEKSRFSSNNVSITTSLGSFKGDDYFKEPFQSWNKSGIRQLCTDQFTMFIYQTMTGLKFIAISTQIPANVNNSDYPIISIQVADNLLRKIYCVYSDYVMKDPFYSMEMPIKSELFDQRVRQMVSNIA
ncbi:TRAPP subunit TRS23 TDEL_0B01600 [Torulaspora delbrueckii]|uniref:Trafficking protein particle complex subunit n=1 Tax=Torulaspora delbrueckii TaxID=4950 RepID=G8ZNU5_TORDE|nr:hypothetical protein TDEL_0B01600 [Torulaspora delbrueckii]CCE90289.1 hypothetical protein TDEL_0B01600 [Torulaspora delbrueckii]